MAAFKLAAQIFPRVSFDMIYARPGQTIGQWRAELGQALAAQEGHMSLYQLTIEQGTRYAELYDQGKLIIPSDDVASDLYDLTQEMTAAAGLACYEISNHAKPGQESRHNLLYWRYGEYAGVGPGAHSRIAAGSDRLALVCEKHPETWRELVMARGHGLVENNRVVPHEQATEYVLMGLRVADGISLKRYEAMAGRALDANKIAGLKSLGLVVRSGDQLAATAAGRKLLNAVISELIV
jgi:coproporphyrinogen III oxidase-like Fe-S oxidoreductase